MTQPLERVRPLVAGRRCVVVGSAPLPTRTADVQAGEVVVCVNGAISSVACAPDLWLVNSKPRVRLTLQDPLSVRHRQMLSQATGRAVGHVALLVGPEDTTSDTLAFLDRRGCRPASWSVIDKPAKGWLEQAVCDRPSLSGKQACSAGIFAVALALWCGATCVRLVGFSWAAGYHYTPTARPGVSRGHVYEDRRALRALLVAYPGRLEGALVPDLAVAS